MTTPALNDIEMRFNGGAAYRPWQDEEVEVLLKEIARLKDDLAWHKGVIKRAVGEAGQRRLEALHYAEDPV